MQKGGKNINPYKIHLNLYIKKKIESILSKESIVEKPQIPATTGVSVIICSNRPSRINDVFENFLRQSYSVKELIVVLNNNSMNLDDYSIKSKDYNNIKIFQLDENLSLGSCFKYALDHAAYDYIAKFDDDDYYGSEYLKQAMETFKIVNCDVVGKASYYIYFNQSKTLARYGEKKENVFINRVADSSLVFRRHVFEEIKIPQEKKAGNFADIQTQIIKNGMKIYSTDRFNYVVNRYKDPEHQHTWKVSDEDYLAYHLVKIVDVNIEDFKPYIEKRNSLD